MRRSWGLLASARQMEKAARMEFDDSTYKASYKRGMRALVRDPSTMKKVFRLTKMGLSERRTAESIYWDMDECLMWTGNAMGRFLSAVIKGLANENYTYDEDRVRKFVEFANREIIPWAAGTAVFGPGSTAKMITLFAMARYDDPIIQLLTNGEFMTVSEVVEQIEKEGGEKGVLEEITKTTYSTEFPASKCVAPLDVKLLEKIWKYNNKHCAKEEHQLNEQEEEVDSSDPSVHNSLFLAAIEGYTYARESDINAKVILWLMSRYSIPLSPYVCSKLAVHYAVVSDFDKFDEMISNYEHAITEDATTQATANAIANFETSRAVRYLTLAKELGHDIRFGVIKNVSAAVESDEDALKVVGLVTGKNLDRWVTPRGSDFSMWGGGLVEVMLMRCVQKEFPQALQETWRKLVWHREDGKTIVIHQDVCQAIIAFVVKKAAFNASSNEFRVLATEVLHSLTATLAPVTFSMLLHLQMLIESQWHQQSDSVSVELLKAVHSYVPNLDERLVYYLPGFKDFRFTRKIVGGNTGLSALCSPYEHILIPTADYCIAHPTLLQNIARGGKTAMLLPFSVLSNLQVIGDEIREAKYHRKMQKQQAGQSDAGEPEIKGATELVQEDVNEADAVLEAFGMYASSFVGGKGVSPNLLILGFIEQQILSSALSDMDPFSQVDRVIAIAAAVLNCNEKLTVTVGVHSEEDSARVKECFDKMNISDTRYDTKKLNP
eukprot:TRINITY_DN12753_c0_g1_i1.p1 TRINITY_DN12753_c0_g1~~TRINITY_DN12753_c0_g1_i1.p1  ORF type:complete len:720 (+),score=118.94 TRINITY_DN12753_c0_g1_i1:42-2201(+)